MASAPECERGSPPPASAVNHREHPLIHEGEEHA
jgi:hypothetical protein